MTRSMFYPVLSVAALLFGATHPASASIVYRMDTGLCTASNHQEVVFPNDPNGQPVFGVGPKVCADQVFVEIRMFDSYVPGSTFFSLGTTNTPNTAVESLYFSDGWVQYFDTFDPLDGFGRHLEGRLPLFAGRAELLFNWHDLGNIFISHADGTWEYINDRNNAICDWRSVEGPYPQGRCNMTNDYVSMGTYSAWTRIPEPGALPLVASALLALGLVRGSGRAGPAASAS